LGISVAQGVAAYICPRVDPAARIPVSALPTVAHTLSVSLDELFGEEAPGGRSPGKRGPASRLHQQIDAVAQLPKAKQFFVSQMIDTVLAQQGR